MNEIYESRKQLENVSCKHPYGVQPSGNSFFCPLKEYLTRDFGIGTIRIFPDSLIIDIFSFCDGITLGCMSAASKGFYVYSHHYELWKNLALKQCGERGFNFISSWKDTYVNLVSKQQYRPHIPIQVNGFYSDFIYRFWLCATFDFNEYCPGFMSYHDVDIRHKSNLSLSEFVSQYEMASRPLVIKGIVDEWPAFRLWNHGNYLEDIFSENRFRVTSTTATTATSCTFRQYMRYALQTTEEAPLYLFDRNIKQRAVQGGENAPKSVSLCDDYEVPVYFKANVVSSCDEGGAGHNGSNDGTNTTMNGHGRHAIDLFSVLGEEIRPDYQWLIMGPIRSGSIFHVDPNQTNAWNACISGRKKWIFYPPGVPPPGVMSSKDGADVLVPVCTAEWLLSFWRYHLEARKNPDIRKRPLEAIVNPGEMMFVPRNWWHMVVNIDEGPGKTAGDSKPLSIAVTQNYVSSSNLKDCLLFLHDKKDQISGLRNRGGGYGGGNLDSVGTASSSTTAPQAGGNTDHAFTLTHENFYGEFTSRLLDHKICVDIVQDVNKHIKSAKHQEGELLMQSCFHHSKKRKTSLFGGFSSDQCGFDVNIFDEAEKEGSADMQERVFTFNFMT